MSTLFLRQAIDDVAELKLKVESLEATADEFLRRIEALESTIIQPRPMLPPQLPRKESARG